MSKPQKMHDENRRSYFSSISMVKANKNTEDKTRGASFMLHHVLTYTYLKPINLQGLKHESKSTDTNYRNFTVMKPPTKTTDSNTLTFDNHNKNTICNSFYGVPKLNHQETSYIFSSRKQSLYTSNGHSIDSLPHYKQPILVQILFIATRTVISRLKTTAKICNCIKH